MIVSLGRQIATRTKQCAAPVEIFGEASGFIHDLRLSRRPNPCGNLLIQGENLAVLGSLLPQYASSVRCCYIDPPYNNRERHYHYHDTLDHQDWLNKVRSRVELLS